jgi:hypothetical protein
MWSYVQAQSQMAIQQRSSLRFLVSVSITANNSAPVVTYLDDFDRGIWRQDPLCNTIKINWLQSANTMAIEQILCLYDVARQLTCRFLVCQPLQRVNLML